MAFRISYKGYRIYVYDNDHGVPHCHILKGKYGPSAVIEIEGVVILKTSGFSPRELREIVKVIEMNKGTLMEAWENRGEES